MSEDARDPTRKPARKTTRGTSKKAGEESASKRKVWMRGFYMLVMVLVLHLAGTLLVIIAILQFMIELMNGAPNERLVAFGRNLGSYLRQIAHFLAYVTEDIPFPFSDWPAD